MEGNLCWREKLHLQQVNTLFTLTWEFCPTVCVLLVLVNQNFSNFAARSLGQETTKPNLKQMNQRETTVDTAHTRRQRLPETQSQTQTSMDLEMEPREVAFQPLESPFTKSATMKDATETQ